MIDRKTGFGAFYNSKFVIYFILAVITPGIVTVGGNYGNRIAAGLVHHKIIGQPVAIYHFSVLHERGYRHRVVDGFIGKETIKIKTDRLWLIRISNRYMKGAVIAAYGNGPIPEFIFNSEGAVQIF